MEFAGEFGNQLLQSLVRLLLNPFYYIGILLIVLQVRRQIALERKLFAVRLHSWAGETVRTVLFGLAAGIAASVAMAAVGIRLELETVILLWIVTFVLVLFRVRYLCLAYSAGFIALAHGILSFFTSWQDGGEGTWIHSALADVDVPSLLTLVAILHLLEGVLVRLQGHRLASPLFVESRRGKLLGGYQLQGYWPVPMFLLVPAAGGPLDLPWNPLYSGNWNVASWGILVFPAVIGFSQLTTAYLPKDKLRQSSGLLFLYSLLLLLFAGLSAWWEPFGFVAAIIAIAVHEGIILYGRRQEVDRHPIFVHGREGLKILAVLPKSVAEEAGIQIGETVHKVNGIAVRTKEDMHMALQTNPAFCRLEVFNLAGESKFISRALYADEHHQLGLILAPDDRAPYFLSEKPVRIGSYLRRKRLGLIRNNRNGRGGTAEAGESRSL